MKDQITLINLRPVWARLPLVLIALAALWVSWHGMRWMVGDTMAEAAPLSYQNDALASFETAEAAARLAPHDPLAYLTLARLHRYSFDPELLPRALSEYEQAAAQVGLELRSLDARHDTALACALPIGRGLARRRWS